MPAALWTRAPSFTAALPPLTLYKVLPVRVAYLRQLCQLSSRRSALLAAQVKWGGSGSSGPRGGSTTLPVLCAASRSKSTAATRKGTAGAAGTAGAKVLLVESPAKAKKIQKFLGDEYKVLASYGHVRDLIQRPGSVVPEEDYAMKWQQGRNAGEHLRAIAAAVKGAQRVILATDPDREGEAISWHLTQELQDRRLLKGVPTERITFSEVTEAAVTRALEQPRELSQPLVDAYLARRALDYLFGFHLSPVLWRKIPVGAKSAGRVQSAALRMLCERESAVEAFVPQQYHSVGARLVLEGGEEVEARLAKLDGSPPPKPGFPDAQQADRVAQRIRDAASWAVADVAKRSISRSPPAPFTTSTLQQEANRRLGLSASRTMQLAQELYEEGHITYMRTDGTALAQEAVQDIRSVLREEYGPDTVPRTPKQYKTKAKNAQEAHEAIRPTDMRLTPATLAGQQLARSAVQLYALIRDRVLSCQAAPAKLEQVSVDFASPDGSLVLRASATTVTSPGYLAVLKDAAAASTTAAGAQEEGGDDAEDAGASTVVGAAAAAALSRLRPGSRAGLGGAGSAAHETRPPGRFSEGTLVKALEDAGIGRPSTYATTIKLLQARGYVRREGRSLQPEPLGRVLSAFLEAYFGRYVDYSFTAKLEEQLDEVAGGRAEWKEVLSGFWGPFQQATASLDGVAVREVIDQLDATLGEQLFAAQQAQQAEQGAAALHTGTSTGGSSSSSGSSGGLGNPRACPSCGTGRLGIKLSPKTGGFIGCSNYPSCTFARPLSTLGGTTAGGGGSEDFELDEEPGTPANLNGGSSSSQQRASRGASSSRRGMSSSSSSSSDQGQGGLEGSLKRAGEGGGGGGEEARQQQHASRQEEFERGRQLAVQLGMKGNARVLGTCPSTGRYVLARSGLYGPYVQLGLDDEPDFKRVPMRKVNVRSMNLERALALLALPRDLGAHPDSNERVLVAAGQFGPFLKCGKVSRSVPAEYDPVEIGLDDALLLLQSKASRLHGKSRRAAAPAAEAGEATAAEERKNGAGDERWPRRPRQKKVKGEAGAAPAAGAGGAVAAAGGLVTEASPAAAGEAQEQPKRRGRKQQQQQQQEGSPAASAAAEPDSSADLLLAGGGSEPGEGLDEEGTAASVSLGDEDFHIANKRSGYQFFLAAHYKDFPDLAQYRRVRLLAREWRGLSPEEKEPFAQREEEDGQRAEMQRAGFMAPSVDWDNLPAAARHKWLADWQRWRERTEAETVRRPSTGYNIFFREAAARLRQDPQTQMTVAVIAEMWRNLPEVDKAKYRRRSREDRKRYQRERAEYIKRKRSPGGTAAAAGGL